MRNVLSSLSLALLLAGLASGAERKAPSVPSVPGAIAPISVPAAPVLPSAPAAVPEIPSVPPAAATPKAAAASFDGLKAPATRRDESVEDDYFGVKIKDPYRWLEDDKSPETAAWVKAQNAATEDQLSRVPERGEIVERLKALWNYERYSAPYK